jgi:hypothetical protein
MERGMPASKEFLEAYRKLEELREEINRKTEEYVRAFLCSSNVQEVRFALHEVTQRVCAIEIQGGGKTKLRIQAQHNGRLECVLDPGDPALQKLEEEWKVLNAQWRIYPS